MSRCLSFARALLVGLLLLVPTAVVVETLTIPGDQAEDKPLAAPEPPPAAAPSALPRWGLVIGNGAYQASVGPLQNPVNDASDMAATLASLGFAVNLLLNATRPQMEEALTVFRQQLRPGSVGVFYFAGHGAQIAGTNYLIPIGANVEKAETTKDEAVAAEQVLARMTEAGSALNILILDACRNNPFIARWPVGVPPGLAPMQAARGSFIAYATSPGAVAADGTGRNGTYTKHLLRHLSTADLPVEQMFKRIRVAVEAETGGAQTPWELSSLQGDFTFRPGAKAEVAASPAVVAAPARPEPTATPATPTAPVVAAKPAPQGQPELARTSWGKDGAEMVLVPAGEFVMGSTPDDLTSLLRRHPKANGAIRQDELPQHRVALEAFYIDKYEVTNARFQQFVQATSYRTQAERTGGGKIRTGAQTWVQVPDATWRAPRGKGSSIAGLERHPVVQVSWHDAKAYCTWAGKRLPSEAEWEKAARGTDGRLYPWGNEFDGTRGNFCDRNCAFPWQDAAIDDGMRSTAPVGSYEAGKSPYGAYDMAGNVWEWVADWYEAKFYQRSPARNPQGPASGTQVVLRGGSWLYTVPDFRTTERAGLPPDRGNENIGFRCAQAP